MEGDEHLMSSHFTVISTHHKRAKNFESWRFVVKMPADRSFPRPTVADLVFLAEQTKVAGTDVRCWVRWIWPNYYLIVFARNT